MGTFPSVRVYVPRAGLAVRISQNTHCTRSMKRMTVPDLDYDDYDESYKGALLRLSSLERSYPPVASNMSLASHVVWSHSLSGS